MRLILIRHGNAAMAPNDDLRPLDDTGREESKILGTWLGRLNFDSPTVWHSNKVRTLQTADIIIQHAQWDSTPIETDGLRPNSPVDDIAYKVEHESQDLVIVGHMPFMGALASCLTTGYTERSQWEFASCGTLILQRAGQTKWVVQAFTMPALIST